MLLQINKYASTDKVFRFISILKVTQLRYWGPWPGTEVVHAFSNMHAVCNCTSLHVLLFSFGLFLFIYFTFFIVSVTPYNFFSPFLKFFEGINWCFVSYSFVSVKGPGRKLSLPTDLKTDLGTVGESQQFPLDFLSVINFLPLSHFRGFCVAFVLSEFFYFFTLKSSFDFLVTLYSRANSPRAFVRPSNLLRHLSRVLVPSTFCKCF